MKLKISMLFGAIIVAHLSYGQTTDPSPYCAGGYDDAGRLVIVVNYISNITLGTLDNTPGDTQSTFPHYIYYNTIATPNLIAGNTYTLSISHGPEESSIDFVAVYIDYNRNNSFYDPGERVLQQSEKAMNLTNPSVATITIPATAKPGITRMRAMVFADGDYTQNNTNATPCTKDSTGYLDWGETQDYNVNITAPTGITGITQNNTALFYPNPVNGIMCADKNLLGAEMIIYNMEGKVVQHGVVTNKTIDVSCIASGQYIIKAISNSNVYTQPLTIIKQ